MATQIAAELAGSGNLGQPLVLGLPSAWCLAAPVAAAGLERRHREQVLAFRLEEQLPLSAEDVVADFAWPPQRRSLGDGPGDGSQVLGIAVPLDRLQSLLDALEQRQVAIDLICPAVLLAWAALAQAGALAAQDLLLWAHGPQVDVLTFKGPTLTGWYLTTSAQLPALLDQLAPKAGGPWRAATAGLPEALARRCAVRLTLTALPTPDLPSLAATAAAGALAGVLPAPVNLRRGALAAADRLRMVRGPLRRALAAALVLAVSCAATLLIGAYCAQGQAAELERRQQVVFQNLYPGKPIPAGMAARLESDARRLRGTAGQGTDISRQRSALAVFYEVLRRLPVGTEVRFRLLEFQVTGEGTLALEGQARGHGDADLIAAALRKQQGFILEAPRTEQSGASTVNFRLAGRLPAPVASPATPTALAGPASRPAAAPPAKPSPKPASQPGGALAPGAKGAKR